MEDRNRQPEAFNSIQLKMSATQNEEGCATVTWEIRNFSYLLEAGENKYLHSPLWKMEHTEGSAEWWRLRTRQKASIIYFDFDCGEEYMPVRKHEMSLVSSDGEVPLEKKCTPRSFIGKGDLLGQNRKTLLPNDTLTLRCRIRNKTLRNRELSIHSKLDRINYLWNIEDFDKYNQFCTYIEHDSFLLEVSLTKKNTRATTHAVIFVLHNAGRCISFVDCEMTFTDGVFQVTNETCSLPYVKWKSDAKIRTKNSTTFCAELMTTVALHKVFNTTELARFNVKNGDFLILFKEKLFCDATLLAEGQSFPAHRGVLAARSPVFRAMFEKTDTREGRSGVVAIDDVDEATLERMLVFLYGGRLGEVGWEEASALYYAADKYDVGPLKQECADILKDSLCVGNACDLLVLADAHSDQELKKCVVSFIQDHQEVVSSKKWEELEDTNPQLTSKTLRAFFLSNKRKK